MTVPARYILAALAFGIAALGFIMLPVDADARSQSEVPQCLGTGGCVQPQPPCNTCNQPPPPSCCERPTVIVPPPHVPPPNIVVVNAGARASASANAIAIAVANVDQGDTIIRQNMVMQGSVQASVTSSALSVTEGVEAQGDAESDRSFLLQAICLDATNNPHPASQTFGESDVAGEYRGEIYRCMSGTRMRYTLGGASHDCAQGEALWHENGRVECRTQIARRPCNERSLLRRFGPGDKFIVARQHEARAARTQTTYNGAMTMDGGVGQGVW